MHEAGRQVLLYQTHTGKGLKLDPFLAWKNKISPVSNLAGISRWNAILGLMGHLEICKMKIFLTYATSNMDKSKESYGVSLSGFGTTLYIRNNFQAIWTHQGPRPKSWGKSFNFNPIIGYDRVDHTLHQTLTGHQDGYQSWWPQLSKFKCPVLISNKDYQIINQILGYSI